MLLISYMYKIFDVDIISRRLIKLIKNQKRPLVSNEYKMDRNKTSIFYSENVGRRSSIMIQYYKKKIKLKSDYDLELPPSGNVSVTALQFWRVTVLVNFVLGWRAL